MSEVGPRHHQRCWSPSSRPGLPGPTTHGRAHLGGFLEQRRRGDVRRSHRRMEPRQPGPTEFLEDRRGQVNRRRRRRRLRRPSGWTREQPRRDFRAEVETGEGGAAVSLLFLDGIRRRRRKLRRRRLKMEAYITERRRRGTGLRVEMMKCIIIPSINGSGTLFC